jgi:hypothetical protein
MSSEVQMSEADRDLAELMQQCYEDPLKFVTVAFPWGEPGPLEREPGPDQWQIDFLREVGAEVISRGFNGRDPVMPIKIAVASGHGIGKSVMAAWICWWIMSTRPQARGTVSANTFVQLQTKTWAAVKQWGRMCITNHWFTITDESFYHSRYKESWRCSPQSCKEENSESFAGQHAKDSTSFYIFDEDSAIPAKIHEVAEGGMTDGEPMQFRFGNPTRNSGDFYEAIYGKNRKYWQSFTVDSRTSRFTNKVQIAEWIERYGEDDDFVRVRVRGLPPKTGDMQFIESNLIFEAQRRRAFHLPDDPVVAGLDASRGGHDETVIRFRKGLNARYRPAIRIRGEQVRDTMLLVSKLSEILGDQTKNGKIDMMFCDSAIGGPVVNRLHQLGFKNVCEINFGWVSPDAHQGNMRAYMWAKLKEALRDGLAIDESSELEIDLAGPGFYHNAKEQLFLESKEDMAKRGLDSPDDGDALALTFARVLMPKKAPPPIPKPVSAWG